MTEDDYEFLSGNGIKDSILKRCPDWLKKWCVHVVEYILLEEEKLPSINQKDCPDANKPTLEYYKIDAIQLRESRLTSLAVTVNKVLHVLSLYTDPAVRDKGPIIKVPAEEILDRLWVTPKQDKSKSKAENFKMDLIYLLDNRFKTDHPAVKQCRDWVTTDPKGHTAEERWAWVRNTVKRISYRLRCCEDHRCQKDALCDFLYLFSKVETYFKPNPLYAKKRD